MNPFWMLREISLIELYFNHISSNLKIRYSDRWYMYFASLYIRKYHLGVRLICIFFNDL